MRGAADLDGDGQTDIVLQYQDGQVVTWLMNGTAIQSGQFIYNGSAAAGWAVRAVR